MFDKPTHTGTMQPPYGLFAAFLRHEEYRSAPYELALSLVWARTTFVQTNQGSARMGPRSVMWLGINKSRQSIVALALLSIIDSVSHL